MKNKTKNNFLKITVIVLACCAINLSCTISSRAQSICDVNSQTNDERHIIDLGMAEGYIGDFYDNFKTITPSTPTAVAPGWVEISIADLGGFSTKDFKENTFHCGLIGYFCNHGDDYTLAFSTEPGFYDGDDGYPIDPANPLAYRSSSCSSNFPAGATRNEIITDIENTPHVCHYATTPIPYADVNEYAYSYMKKMNDINHGAMENPVGFFHYDQMHQLLNQGHGGFIGIRIYWGYERHSIHEKIRIIAFVVKPDGTNYVRALPGERLIILERSWPPN